MVHPIVMYPSFIVDDYRGIIPKVYVPENWEELIPSFFESKFNEDMEEYVKELVSTHIFQEFEVNLFWDERLGLKNISIGVSGGFDFNEDWKCFMEHNLNTETGLLAALIAMKYVQMLLNCIE